MSAKILKALSEDPQQLEKQLEKEIGCMTGMLQIFDRQNAITGRRFGHRRLSGARSMPTSGSGSPRFDGSGSANFTSVFGDDRSSSIEKQAESLESRVGSSDYSAEPSKSNSVASRDVPRLSSDVKVEPGRASLGSKDQPRLSFYFKDVPPSSTEPAKDPPRNSIAGLTAKERAKLGPSSAAKEEPRVSYDSREQGRPAFDIREAVRMSFNRDPPRASLDRSAVHQQSDARPSLSRQDTGRLSVDGREPPRASLDRRESTRIVIPRSHKEPPRASLDGREMSRSSIDLRETLRALSGKYSNRDGGRLSVDGRDAPRSSLDLKEPPRFSVSRDAPRFSLDGREPPRYSLDSRESMARGQQKVRDAPRLSTDGRDAPRHSLDQRDLLLANLQIRETSSGFLQSRDFSRTSMDSRSSRASSDSLGNSTRDRDALRLLGQQKGVADTKMSLKSLSEGSQQREVQAAADSKRRVPNVVARLMGLEELPDTTTPAQQQKAAPIVAPPSRKPSTEAKLLQELLQYKPLEQPQTKQVVEQKQASPVNRQSSKAQDNKQDSSLFAAKNSASRKVADAEPRPAQKEGPFYRQEDFRSDSFHQSRRAPEMGGGGRSYEPAIAQVKPPPSAFRNFTEPMPKQQEVSETKYAELQKQFPEAILTVLKHSEEVKKQQQSSNTLLGELEERLQQLRVKNSQQERKTLRQILEAMQLKGLLHPPRREAAQQSMDEDFAHPNSYGGYYYKRDRPYEGDQSPRMKAIQDMKAIHDMRAYQEMRAAEDNMIEVSIVEGKAIHPQQYTKQASIVVMKPVTRQQQVIKQKAVETMPAAGAPSARGGGRAGKVSGLASRTSKGQHGLPSIATPREPICKFNAEETMSFRKRRASMTLAKDVPSVSPTPESRQASKSARAHVPASPPKSKVLPAKEPATISRQQSANGRSTINSSLYNSRAVENGRKQRMSRDASSPQGRRSNDPEPRKVLRRSSSDVGSQSPAVEAAVKVSLRASGKSTDKGRQGGSLSDSEASRRAAAVNKDVTLSGSSQSEEHPPTGSKISRKSAPQRSAQSAISGTKTTTVVRPNLEEARDHSFDILSLEHLASTLPYPEVSVDKFEQEPSQPMSGGSFSNFKTVLLNQDEVKYLGEVMADGAEQPSPVSVLDASFQDEDHSPRAVNKNILSLKDAQFTSRLEALANELAWEEQLEDDVAAVPSAEPGSVMSAEMPTKPSPSALQPEDMILLCPARDVKQPLEGSKAEEMAYVRDVLMTSGLTDESKVILAWHSPNFPMDPELFDRSEEKRRRLTGEIRACNLEVDEISRIESLRRSEQEVMDRRLLFDSVNDITARKLRPYLVSKPWISQSPVVLRKPPTGHLLVEEVWAELQELPCPPSEDVCDTLYTMLQKDLAHKGDRWLEYSTEIGEVGLELERMIFKELIEETVTACSGFSSLGRISTHRPAACAY